jgi:hypothetical protein
LSIRISIAAVTRPSSAPACVGGDQALHLAGKKIEVDVGHLNTLHLWAKQIIRFYKIDRACLRLRQCTLPSQQFQKFVSRYFCLFENIAQRSLWNVASMLSYNGSPRRVIIVP